MDPNPQRNYAFPSSFVRFNSPSIFSWTGASINSKQDRIDAGAPPRFSRIRLLPPRSSTQIIGQEALRTGCEG
ncbi:hypothetical protein NMY22_g3285 [Coprinellus aureogranulatus]|nr:hypothetical protein NMY22_g3285 [Coprinellus aureogranulatus]